MTVISVTTAVLIVSSHPIFHLFLETANWSEVIRRFSQHLVRPFITVGTQGVEPTVRERSLGLEHSYLQLGENQQHKYSIMLWDCIHCVATARGRCESEKLYTVYCTLNIYKPLVPAATMISPPDRSGVSCDTSMVLENSMTRRPLIPKEILALLARCLRTFGLRKWIMFDDQQMTHDRFFRTYESCTSCTSTLYSSN